METLGRQRRGENELATLSHTADNTGQVPSLTGTPQRADRIWVLTFTLLLQMVSFIIAI